MCEESAWALPVSTLVQRLQKSGASSAAICAAFGRPVSNDDVLGFQLTRGTRNKQHKFGARAEWSRPSCSTCRNLVKVRVAAKASADHSGYKEASEPLQACPNQSCRIWKKSGGTGAVAWPEKVGSEEAYRA